MLSPVRATGPSMATFEYRAINRAGTMTTGTMDAASIAELFEQLDHAGYTPLSGREVAAAGRSWRDLLTPEPRPQDITGFTLDLAMLLKGGVVLGEALQILGDMEEKRWLAKLIRQLHVELAGGKSFSQVLAMHPALFPPVYVKMVEVAEAGGRLEQALNGIARERQRNEQLRSRFLSAITYPLFLVCAAIGVFFFVMLYVVPQFEGALQGFRDRIDPSALVVFELSRGLRDNLDLVVLGAAAVLGAGLAAKLMLRGRSVWISLFARLPITKTIISHDLTLTFCRTLSVLAATGVDISTSLGLIRGVLRAPGAAAEIDHVIADVRQGSRLSTALSRRTLLPRHVVQLLRVAEEAGNLPEAAERISFFYEAKLDSSLGRLIAVVGPLMMVAVSLLVAWLIISVMTALISINDLLV